ncbi:uncharacterized protein LOC122946099 [Bufo gargarizans]|uniref:uncharacterized protein LOC122919591 n=2 Tax=Bufo gargarizans TaxID=30331 RepID=UPI001CF38535|nr:uncharacterized protein LOC122919591 [Bufo gargarizans]XP_044127897.1 uncharacterized protein LOC122921725 [Bufo gargarizans]XP_044150092.1 uncharacterized protein LOC122938567 [Bufo gargarizans]XP_044161374.1 uncharacterized protein LOC122946099 [Bufo gargarizans]
MSSAGDGDRTGRKTSSKRKHLACRDCDTPLADSYEFNRCPSCRPPPLPPDTEPTIRDVVVWVKDFVESSMNTLRDSVSSRRPSVRSPLRPTPMQEEAYHTVDEVHSSESSGEEEEAGRAPATVKAYARVKRIFLLWCASHQVPSQDPPVSAILQFMQDGLDKGLSPSTLKVQISALSAAFGRSLHQDPLIKRFLKGAVRLKPSISRPIPQWDLSVVLKGLSGPPFEPLEEVDFKFLSWKVTFLLAVTSAKRISELQAFSAYEPYTLFLPDRVLLRFLPTFLPKVPSVHNINQVVSLPVLCSSSSSAEETSLHTLDVARCLRIYIERSREFRRSENLLILFFGRNKGKKASKPTLSRWIREAIRESFASQNRPPPAFVTAHSTRAVSTSWAERSLIPLEQICSAASWSSHSTFVSHYRLNLRGSEDTAFGRSVLNSIQH